MAQIREQMRSIISSSSEERSAQRTPRSAVVRREEREIIEISSDDDDFPEKPIASKPTLVNRRRRRVPISEPKDVVIVESSDDESIKPSGAQTTPKPKPPSAHKTAMRGSCHTKPNKKVEIIDLTLSSSESEHSDAETLHHKGPRSSLTLTQPVLPRKGLIHFAPDIPQRLVGRREGPHFTTPSTTNFPSWQVLSDTDSHDELDEEYSEPESLMSPRKQTSPRKRILPSDSQESTRTPVRSTPAAKVNKAGKAPRQTKKAKEAEERQRRETYASTLFRELNESVFNNGLPQDTPLRWNNRLLTTAGRACCHKPKDGAREVYIELATKILDSDARIRNTLSHEMCHLASWVIDGQMKENHGTIFKRWAKKVMKKRPDIAITTKHNYAIEHPYEWTCQECSKVYGRFSNSIDVTKVACGNCRGTLRPMFEVRTPKTPRNKAPVGRPIEVQVGDSPCPAPSLVDSMQDLTIVVSRKTGLGSGKASGTLEQSLNLLSLDV